MIELRDICNKGHQMELRQTEVREDEENPKSKIILWLLMGVCDKCQTIVMQGIHKEKIAPSEGIDYFIAHKKIGKTKKKLDALSSTKGKQGEQDGKE